MDVLHREPDVSVVLLATDDTVSLIDAVLRLTRVRPPRTQIVAVDNGSWPGVNALLDALDVEVVRAPQAVGAAAAWVAGLRQVTGDIVVAATADVALRPGWRSRVVEALRDREAIVPAQDPSLGTWVGASVCLAARTDAVRQRGPFAVGDGDPTWLVGVGGGPDRSRWREEMRHELLYWGGKLAEVVSGVGPYARGFPIRLDPGLPLTPLIGEAVNPVTCDGDSITVLDVGSGPAPIVGRWWQGRPVEVTSFDPLAPQYAVLIEAAGIDPTIAVRPGQVETILDDIGEQRFDVVWMSNALDHSEDAVQGVRNLVAAAKPGGAIVLTHVENEGEHASYEGLHHWNITIENGRPKLWWRGGELWLDEWLGAEATVESAVRRDGEWIDVVLRRPGGPAAPVAAPSPVLASLSNSPR